MILLLFILVNLETLLSTKSTNQRGTLYQMRNLLGRTNVKKDPVKDFDSCEDFFITVVQSLVFSVCMKEFEMGQLHESPRETVVLGDAWLKSDDDRKKMILSICDRVISNSVKFRFIDENTQPSKDLVTEYGLQLLSIGMFL